MHLLDRDILFPVYDVLVVGAGIGGLTTAALLAKRGMRVLVVEQHYLPGGCASIFRRKGFTFDVGASLFFGFGEKGYNPHQFVMNEIEEDITLVQMDETFTIHLDKQTKVSMYTQREKFSQELCSCFPHQKKEIKSLLKEFESFYKDSLDSYGGQFFAPAETPPKHGRNLMFTKPLYLVRLLTYLLSTQEQLFRRFTRDPQILKLFTLLNQNMTTCGLDQTPAIAGPMIHVEAYTGGCCYAHGSPQMLANKLEKAIHKYGGQVLYRHRVDKILIENGRAIGCQLHNGIQLKAETIVSNTTIWNLYGKLIDKKNITRRKRRWAEGFRPSYSVFGVYLGVNSEAVPQGTKPTQILPYVDEGFPSYLTVYVTSMLDPSASPKGTHTLCIFLPETTPDKTTPTDGKDKYQTRSYRERKEKKAAAIIEYLEHNYFPGLRQHIIVQETATPETIQRYTLKNHGSIGGPQVNMKQSYMSRLAARSDWEGLYCVGDSTSQGIGVVSVTVSAISAVNAILADKGESQYTALTKYPNSYVHFSPATNSSPKFEHNLPLANDSSTPHSNSSGHCLSPRCHRAYPDNTHLGQISRLVESGNLIGAAKSMRAINPFSETTAYLSNSDDFCGPGCSKMLCPDELFPIKSLSRHICEHVPDYKIESVPFNGMTIAVVGAGPAGLTCAHYLARIGYQIDLYEKGSEPGGRLRWMTNTSRVPQSILTKELSNLLLPSIRIHYQQKLGKDITIHQLSDQCDALFIACGLGGRQIQTIPTVPEEKFIHALDFLDHITSDKSIVRELTITIIGSTLLSTEIAMVAVQAGAKQVSLISEQNAQQIQLPLQEMKTHGINIHLDISPERYSEYSQSSDLVVLSAVEHLCVDKELSDYFIKSLGTDINPFADLEIPIINSQHMIFAGGDIVNGPRTVLDAIKDGRKAAKAINEELIKH